MHKKEIACRTGPIITPQTQHVDCRETIFVATFCPNLSGFFDSLGVCSFAKD